MKNEHRNTYLRVRLKNRKMMKKKKKMTGPEKVQNTKPMWLQDGTK